MDRWLEVTVTASAAEAVDCELALERLGAEAVTLTDADDRAGPDVLEPAVGQTPVWPQVNLAGLFPIDADPWLIRAALANDCQPTGFSHRLLADQDWTRAWMSTFEPQRFGQSLWIVPTHHQAPADADCVVRLDPGLAFGSGTHPTTALCMELIDQLAEDGAWSDATVLDFGCGSGVLAIAALCRGAGRALCVDNDPQALKATADNAARNGVADRLQIMSAEALPPASADLVLANILARTLIDLRAQLTEAAKPGATIGLSGLLLDQGQPVRRAYQQDFDQFEVWQRQEWLLLTAIKR